MRLPWRSKKAETDRLLRELTIQHARELDEREKERAKEERKKKEEEAKTLEWLQGQAKAVEEKEKKPRTGKAGARKRKYPRTGKEGAAKR